AHHQGIPAVPPRPPVDGAGRLPHDLWQRVGGDPVRARPEWHHGAGTVSARELTGYPMPADAKRRRILFIAEAVTLAHVARASVLAGALDPARYDVHAAWDPRYDGLLGRLPYPVHLISTMPGALFLKRLARGQPMHDASTLRAYVKEDLATIA